MIHLVMIIWTWLIPSKWVGTEDTFIEGINNNFIFKSPIFLQQNDPTINPPEPDNRPLQLAEQTFDPKQGSLHFHGLIGADLQL